MTAKARTSDELAALFDQHLADQVVARLLVHGVNSLKSMDPQPDMLAGQRMRGITAKSETTFDLAIDAYVLEVDLQRTGAVRWLANLQPWSFGQPSMPTGQLLFQGGGGVNFAEPAKTKRITFRLRRS